MIPLVRSSWFRALITLLLTAMLSGFVVASCRVPVLLTQWNSIITVMEQEFGSLIVKGMFQMEPEKAPDTARSVLLPSTPPVLVCYSPIWGTLPEDFNHDKVPQGILWFPQGVYVWALMEGGTEYMFMDLNSHKKLQIKTDAEFSRLQFPEEPGYPLEMNSSLSWNSFRGFLPVAASIGVFLMQTLHVLTIAAITIGLFTLVFLVTGGGKSRGIRLGELLKIELYSGIPAILVGTFFLALDLDLLDYNTIYMVGMPLYLLFAMNAFERFRYSQSSPNGEA